MTKKGNTLVFMLGATVFNILLTGAIFFALFFLLMVLMARGILGENAASWGLIVVFVLSLVLSFFLYRAIIKVLSKKIDLDKYFSPIFSGAPKKRR